LNGKWTCMELTTSMNSNLEKLKGTKARIHNITCTQIKIKQPKLTTKVLHIIDDNSGWTWHWQYLNEFQKLKWLKHKQFNRLKYQEDSIKIIIKKTKQHNQIETYKM